jgi:hypothetical protein
VDARYSALVSDLEAACDGADFRSYLQQLENAYVQTTPAEREALRHFVRSDRQFSDRFEQQMRQVLAQAERGWDFAASLRLRLLRVSVTDCCGSSLVYNEWLDAVARGIDPAPHFQQIAAVSNSDVLRGPRAIPQARAAMLHVAADIGRFWPPEIGRIPGLIAALRSGERGTQLAATAALCLLGPKAKAAAAALSEVMQAGIRDKSLRVERPRLIQSTLARIGAEAVPALQPLLADPDSSIRLSALYVLASMGAGASAAVTVIGGLVDDPDQLVCCQALTTLGAIGSEAVTAIPIIRRALHDEDYFIRMNARLALKKLDSESGK